MGKNKYLILIIILASLLYSPAILNFFSGDDWFHLRVAQISSWHEVVNFFSLSPTPQSILFYRPLSTQVFFYIFQNLFGLNAIPYFLFQIILLGVNLYLIYRLTLVLFNKKSLGLLTIFFYGFSVANFSKMYLISTVQETLMLSFVLLTSLTFIKRIRFVPIILFIFALLSKETAIILPLLLFGILWVQNEWNRTGFKSLIPYIMVSLFYLALRVTFYPQAGNTYQFDLSLLKLLNTLIWYGLWSFGAPELLVDYIGSGFIPVAKFFSDFPVWSYWILGMIILTGVFLGWLLIKSIKSLGKGFILAIFWFVIGLLPVMLLPWHKFTIQLTLPLIGFTWVLSLIVFNYKSKYKWFFVLSWLVLNLSMHYLTYTRHYSINRSIISAKVLNYINKNYPSYPEDAYFEFVNDSAKQNYVEDWGTSKQISHAISRSEMFRVIYRNHDINVYYEDYNDEPRPIDKKRIPISSIMFLE